MIEERESVSKVETFTVAAFGEASTGDWGEESSESIENEIELVNGHVRNRRYESLQIGLMMSESCSPAKVDDEVMWRVRGNDRDLGM